MAINEEERIDMILRWATLTRGEDSIAMDYWDSNNIRKSTYYWAPQTKRILNSLLRLKKDLKHRKTSWGSQLGDCLLIGIIGKSGVGKTSLLYALDSEVRKFFIDQLGEKFEERFVEATNFERKSVEKIKNDVFKICDYSAIVFVDMPDYSRRDVRKINTDLTQLYHLWKFARSWNRKTDFIIFFQKELVQKTNHFFLSKMAVTELKPLTPNQLVEVFKLQFATSNPFAEDAIELIAELSKGIPRRFKNYIRSCVENMLERGREEITSEDVGSVVTSEVLMKDLELELSDMFQNERYRRCAVDILTFLRSNENLNQKTLAGALDIDPTTLGKIAKTLENHSYIKRARGKHGQWLVSPS